jgi:hypothetical protein
VAELFGDAHPIARAARGIVRLSEAAFATVWLAVLLIESFLALLSRGGLFAVELVCAVLDWVGADY